ncbi:MAG: ABC transporter permease [Emergencia sp.]
MNNLSNDSRQESRKQWMIIAGIIIVFIAACIIFNSVYEGKFLNLKNISLIVSHAIIPAFVGWGLCFIFACDYTDMSIGAVIVIAANVAGLGGMNFGYPGVIIGGIGAGILLLTFNFIVFVTTNIPSWIAGIGLAMVYEALAVFYSNLMISTGSTLPQLPDELRLLAKAPYIYIVFFIGLVLAYIIYNRTQVGINIRALGSGIKVSQNMGINIKKTLICVGVICGIFVGIAALLNESYNARLTAKSGLTSLAMIFQPMAAVLLAQVLQSKINIIIAVPICSLIVYTIFNMLTIAGVPTGTWQEAVLGAIVIIFGVIAQRKETGVVK